MPAAKSKLSIVIPTYNEANTIRELLERVQRVHFPIDYEIIVVDDASIDRTYEREILIKLRNERNNIRIFRNRINQGKGFSIRKGIKRASGNLIVIQDGDQEYNPQEIPKLLEPILQGEAEVVYGSRFLNRPWPEGMALANWIANRFLTKMTNLLFGLRLTDMETCYKIFRVDLLRAMNLRSRRFGIEVEVTAYIAKLRVRVFELPISYVPRQRLQGKKIGWRDGIAAIFHLVRFNWGTPVHRAFWVIPARYDAGVVPNRYPAVRAEPV